MKMGRPTKKTPHTQEVALKAIAMGATGKQAAKAAGIGTTVLKEMQRDIPAFAEGITRAKAIAEGFLLDRIELASREPKYWGAAAQLLKFQYPEKYGPKVQISGDPDKPAVQIEWSKISTEELRNLIKSTDLVEAKR